METEQTAYEVPGSQLRWRASQLNAQGYPFQVQPAAGGVYIVIVQQPAGVNPFAYAEYSRPRQAWPAWDAERVLRWVLVVAIVAAAGWFAWSLFAGGDAPALPPAQTDNVWDWFDSLRLPWEPAAAAAPAAKPVQAEPFRWPWEGAADGLAAAESVQGTVTTVSTAILGVLVLLIILALVRRGGRR